MKINSSAAIKRIPVGTKLIYKGLTRLLDPNGVEIERKEIGPKERTMHLARSKDVIFLNERGDKSYLTLSGNKVIETPTGFKIELENSSVRRIKPEAVGRGQSLTEEDYVEMTITNEISYDFV